MIKKYDKVFKIPIVVNNTLFYFVYFIKVIGKEYPIFEFHTFLSNAKGEIIKSSYLSQWPELKFTLYEDTEIMVRAKSIREFYNLLLTHIRIALKTGIDLSEDDRFETDMHNFTVIPDFNLVPTFVNVKTATKRWFPQIAEQSKFFDVDIFNVIEGPKDLVELHKTLVDKLHLTFMPLSSSEEKRLADLKLPISRLKNVLWTYAYRKELLKIILTAYKKKTGKYFIPVIAMEDEKLAALDKKMLNYVSMLTYEDNIHVMGKYIYPAYEDLHEEKEILSIIGKRYDEILQAKGQLVGIRTYDIFFPGLVKIVPVEKVKIINSKTVEIEDHYDTYGTVKEAKDKKTVILPIDRLVFYGDLVKDKGISR